MIKKLHYENQQHPNNFDWSRSQTVRQKITTPTGLMFMLQIVFDGAIIGLSTSLSTSSYTFQKLASQRKNSGQISAQHLK